MKTKFLQLLSSIPVFMMPKQVLPADVAPPPGAIVAVSVGVLIVLGLIVAIIVGISIVVIRAIKKSNTPKDDA